MEGLIGNYNNKKVILRERKRHTARCVASTRYACCSVQWGAEMGYPPPDMGYPLDMGYPSLDMGYHPRHGYLPWTWGPPPRWGTPPEMGYPRTWDGVPPYPDLKWGTPPTSDLRWGKPPPPASVNRLKILPSPILRMRAVKINIDKNWIILFRSDSNKILWRYDIFRKQYQTLEISPINHAPNCACEVLKSFEREEIGSYSCNEKERFIPDESQLR